MTEYMGKWIRYNALEFGIRAYAFHCKRFARSSLTIGEHCTIVAFQHESDYWSKKLEFFNKVENRQLEFTLSASFKIDILPEKKRVVRD